LIDTYEHLTILMSLLLPVSSHSLSLSASICVLPIFLSCLYFSPSLSAFLFLFLSVSLSASPYVCLPVSLSLSPSPSFCLPTSLSKNISLCGSDFMCLSLSLWISLSVSVSVYLCVSLCISLLLCFSSKAFQQSTERQTDMQT